MRSPRSCTTSVVAERHIANRRAVLRLRGHTSHVYQVEFNSDGRRLVSTAHDGTIRLWEAKTGREILPLIHAKGDQLTGASFSPDGRQIVSTSMSGTVKVWDATPLSEPSGASQAAQTD